MEKTLSVDNVYDLFSKHQPEQNDVAPKAPNLAFVTQEDMATYVTRFKDTRNNRGAASPKALEKRGLFSSNNNFNKHANATRMGGVTRIDSFNEKDGKRENKGDDHGPKCKRCKERGHYPAQCFAFVAPTANKGREILLSDSAVREGLYELRLPNARRLGLGTKDRKN